MRNCCKDSRRRRDEEDSRDELSRIVHKRENCGYEQKRYTLADH
jgi:hypothetical protein